MAHYFSWTNLKRRMNYCPLKNKFSSFYTSPGFWVSPFTNPRIHDSTLKASIDVASSHDGDKLILMKLADLIKTILHDWSDDECMKILQNCKKVIPKDIGKLIIVEIVLQTGDDRSLDDIRLMQDLSMITTNVGKERSEVEWKDLLEKFDFSRYKIIENDHDLHSIIEAFTC
ncbi:hypothetical protein ACFE04_017264 [Oxalis oulophora]